MDLPAFPRRFVVFDAGYDDEPDRLLGQGLALTDRVMCWSDGYTIPLGYQSVDSMLRRFSINHDARPIWLDPA